MANQHQGREFLQATIEALDPHLAVLDAQGTIVMVNEAWRRFARENGLAPERAGPGVSYLEACDAARGEGEEDGRAAAAGIRAVLAGELATFALPYGCHSPTEERWFYLRLTRFEHAGATWAVAAHENVTEPRHSEQEMRRAKAAADASNHAKDQFLAVLGHELRTPLTPVLLRLTSLLEQGGSPPSVRAALQMIQRNVELEARLIDDLLDICRLTRDRLELVEEIVDAHEELRAAVEIFEQELQDKGLVVENDLRARRSHVRADRARLRQSFWNLVSNAVKYTPRGGRIALRSWNGDPALLAVSVSDTGIGLDRETLQRVFKPFEQADQTLSRRFGGLGLGLSISQKLIERMQGTLTAASPGRNRGATFTVTLPAVAPPRVRRPPRATRAAERAQRPLRILLVEDNEETLELLAEQLSRVGHHVRTATGVGPALEIALTEEVDLMIADIGLPDGTGWDLMQTVRRQRPIPGIALSGFASRDDVHKSQVAGFVEHVSKPVSIRELQGCIGRALA